MRAQVARASLAVLGLLAAPTLLRAAPYASGVSFGGVGGLDVNFILNEPADSLTYSINGGAALPLTTTKGAKTFTRTSLTDTFEIFAHKNATLGYSIPTGGTVLTQVNGFGQDSPEAGFSLISDNANPLNQFLAPRGIDVGKNPNASNFGTTYVGNVTPGATTGVTPGRTVGDGMYAVKADQSDAFGYGDTAQNPLVPDAEIGPSFPAFVTSTSSPWRVFVADSGDVYVSDWSDANGQLFSMGQNLLTADNVFGGYGGPAGGLPSGQNHGSVSTPYVEGSTAGGNLVVWTVDEDLTTAHVTGTGATNDQNSVWRYDINSGAAPLPHTAMPTKFADGLIALAHCDLDRGADGKFYLAQNRNVGNESGLVVTDASGALLFDSLVATRTLLGNPTAVDIIRNVQGMAVSDDQQWVAIMMNNSDVGIIPLVAGIPDLAGRMVVNTGTDITSGRDIAFDAAGNIHYVTSGRQLMQVIAPGGDLLATTSYDGTEFDFTIAPFVVEEDDADFDGDDDVDGNDFLMWQRGVGIDDGSADPEDGDADNDGNVDGDDLDIWKDQFGVASTVASRPVPEPSTWAMAVLAAAACVAATLPRRRALVPVSAARHS